MPSEKILKKVMKHLLDDMQTFMDEKAEDQKLYKELKKASRKVGKNGQKKRDDKGRQRG